MLRLTLAQMRRSLPRLVAAGIAILLGSAFLTATLTAGDIITRTGYDQVTATYGQADLVVRPSGTDPLDPPITQTLAAVRDTPGVVAADPLVTGYLTLVSGRRDAWTLAIPATSSPRLASLEVTQGAAPVADDEIAVPTALAERLGVGVGDTVQVTWSTWQDGAAADAGGTDDQDTDEGRADDEGADAGAPAEPDDEGTWVDESAAARVVGLLDDPRGAWAGYGGAALATADSVARWSGAASLDELPGTVIVAADGDVAATAAALRGSTPGVDVLTRDEAAAETVKRFSDGGNVLVMMVLGFAAVAMLVAALVIANTFQVLVAQRTRMLALLRCVGARRGQLRRTVLLEATLLGTVAGAVGVVAGLGLSQGALSVLSRTQESVPLPTTVGVSWKAVLVPVAVSVVVTVLAALVPARNATRVSPVAALRPADAPTVHARPGRVRLVFSLLLVVGGLVALLGAVALARSGMVADPMATLALGVLGGAASFVGLLIGAPLWVPRVVSALGRPVARMGPSARLAAANTLRNPRRTAATSTALVIGVTLVVMMSTGAVSARTSLADAMTEQGPYDTALAFDEAVPTEVADAAMRLDGVARVATVRSGQLSTPSGPASEALVVADDAVDVVRDATAAAALADNRSVVPDRLADDGATTATFQHTGRTSTADVDVLVTGTRTALVTSQTADLLGFPDAHTVLLVRLAPGADAVETLRDLQDLPTDVGFSVESPAAQQQQDEQVIDILLAIVIGLLGVAVVIALIGVANTLSLSVIERRRESATLRAVGLSRRGLRWMLATEGMLIAGVGAVIGSALGLLYGWAGAATVFGTASDLHLAVPWGHLAAVLVVALLAGLAASVLPARAAARTPPVAALGVD